MLETNSVKGVLNDDTTLHKYLYSGLSPTDCDESRDWTTLEHNKAPNLNDITRLKPGHGHRYK